MIYTKNTRNFVWDFKLKYENTQNFQIPTTALCSPSGVGDSRSPSTASRETGRSSKPRRELIEKFNILF